VQLIYDATDRNTIIVKLEEGERLGLHFVGPLLMHVPVDPANAEYAEILAKELPIEEPTEKRHGP
jgi:hypothetical protein